MFWIPNWIENNDEIYIFLKPKSNKTIAEEGGYTACWVEII